MTPTAGSARALGRVTEAGGAELAERLVHLDRVWAERGQRLGAERETIDPPAATDAIDVDVVIAGGGLWSLLAPILAARGLTVCVMDRARAAHAHREWNASGAELAALVRVGLVDDATLARLVIARYDVGTCAFHGGAVYPVKNVLDHAVDAGALLTHGRALGERRGVRYLDGHTVVAQASGSGRVRVRAEREGGHETITARVLVDARGAASPFATADLVCPTVGGVLSGIAEGTGPKQINPRVGEILATVDDIDARGRQHVWEAFPGAPGETTTYVFYYAHADEPASLVDLYDRFWTTLPSYKDGDVRLVRPTFGFIPGWSRLSPAPRPPPGRVVLVGDAAARHSPLTYCGFGATLRSLGPAAEAIATAAASETWRAQSIVDDAPVHSLTGALAHMLATRAMKGGALNALLDAAFRTLHEMGDERYAALLRDEMPPADFVSFLRRTAARHPAVWGDVVRGLGFLSAGKWSWLVARSLVRA